MAWVVEFKSKAPPHPWQRILYLDPIYEYEEAQTQLAIEVFSEPDWEYRIREIKEG
jgi:hypothetical protein